MPTPPLNSGTTRASSSGDAPPLVGISFPFRKENGEFPARSRDAECVKDDLLTLFRTPIRSRVMRPQLGTTAFSAVFESQGGLLQARLVRGVRQTIANNEPRVRADAIRVEENGTEVDVTVSYTLKGVRETLELDTFTRG